MEAKITRTSLSSMYFRSVRLDNGNYEKLRQYHVTFVTKCFRFVKIALRHSVSEINCHSLLILIHNCLFGFKNLNGIYLN